MVINMVRYSIVGIYELSVNADSLEEAMEIMMNMKLNECENIYVSDYDCEE